MDSVGNQSKENATITSASSSSSTSQGSVSNLDSNTGKDEPPTDNCVKEQIIHTIENNKIDPSSISSPSLSTSQDNLPKDVKLNKVISEVTFSSYSEDSTTAGSNASSTTCFMETCNLLQPDGFGYIDPEKINWLNYVKKNIIKPNVLIKVGQHVFPCNLLVLQTQTKFFRKYRYVTTIELPEEKVTPDAFAAIYEWMIKQQPVLESNHIIEVYAAAEFLGAGPLIQHCWCCFDRNFMEDKAFIYYLESSRLNLRNLGQLILSRISRFFLTVVASKEFLMMSAEAVCTLLGSSAIGVNLEMEILMTAVRWLNHDWKERKKDSLQLMKCVRFGLMPPWYLLGLVDHSDCTEVDRVVKQTAVKKQIDGAVLVATYEVFTGAKRTEVLTMLERQNLVFPNERQWIYDGACKYHRSNMQKYQCRLTYDMFLLYLDFIRSAGPDHWHSLKSLADLINWM